MTAGSAGSFVAGSLAWGMAMDGFRPDRYDTTGALICLIGVAVIMYSPRPASPIRSFVAPGQPWPPLRLRCDSS